MSHDGRMLARQARHDLDNLRRTPITLILSIGFPLLFFVLIAALVGNRTLDERSGIRVAQFLAPAFASFGVVMATFAFLAFSFAEARATGVLKRQAGTPMPRWVLLGGRMVAAMLLGLAATALVVGVGVAFYGVQVIWRTLPAALLTLVAASMAFSALGLALAALLPNPQMTLAVSNGIAITLSFFSDIFEFGATAPTWVATLGWVFPLKHLVNAFGDAFNPYLSGSGLYLDHLGVILAWGVAGALVAAWALRAERGHFVEAQATSARQRARDRRPRRDARPSAVALVRDQIAHTTLVLWRDIGSVFFAIAFPVLLVAVIPTVNGGGDQLLSNGIQFGAYYAGTMAIYGAAVTAYVNMPTGLAEARERGVLKRERGASLPEWALLSGRVVGAIWVGLLTLAAALALAALMYHSPMPSWPAALLTFLTATLCFSFVGLGVVSLARSAQSGIGLTLGTLLPLCFISDVFIVGAPFPEPMERLSWFFPLRHATSAMTGTLAPGGAAPAWGHLGVLALWALAGLLVVAWRFSWEARAPRRPGRSGGSAPGEIGATAEAGAPATS